MKKKLRNRINQLAGLGGGAHVSNTGDIVAPRNKRELAERAIIDLLRR